MRVSFRNKRPWKRQHSLSGFSLPQRHGAVASRRTGSIADDISGIVGRTPSRWKHPLSSSRSLGDPFSGAGVRDLLVRRGPLFHAFAAVSRFPEAACEGAADSYQITDRRKQGGALWNASACVEVLEDVRRATSAQALAYSGMGERAQSHMVRPAGVEPATPGLGNQCSIH